MDFKFTFKEWFFLSESVQQITNLGFPAEVAKIIKKHFGKNAYKIAQWFKEYETAGIDLDDSKWWNDRLGEQRPVRGGASLNSIIRVMRATDSPEKVKDALGKNGFYVDDKDVYDDYRMQEIKDGFAQELEEQLMKNIFFRAHPFIKDIQSGKIKMDAYKNLNFKDAHEKYEEKKLFREAKPIVEYPNGMKWIEAGTYCKLLGNAMRNCGSIGVMSTDPDRKIIALFDAHNNPHVMLTYSPNHNRISGEQGKASTKIKPEYDHYVLDLAEKLGATYDWMSQGAHNRTQLKYLLGDDSRTLEQIGGTEEEPYYSFYQDGKKYYTDTFKVASQEQVDKAKELIKNGELKNHAMHADSDKDLAISLLMARRDAYTHILGPFVGPMKFASPDKLKLDRGAFG